MSEPVDTTVITLVPVDYGAGEHDRIVFHDCRYRVDDMGALVVYPANDPDKIGNVATFAPGQWASVIRGTVTALVVQDGNTPGTTAGAGVHRLEAVQS